MRRPNGRKDFVLDLTQQDKAPPEAHPAMWSGLRRAQAPIQRFMALESAGGYVLAIVTVIALAWANVSYESYEALWHTEFGFRFMDREFVHPVHFWINEGAMSVFFLLAGLEIKRQIVEGELSTLRRAMLPVVAAAGGMIVPAVIYAAFNPHAPELRGAAVPTATDIAFAVGVITLLGNRVPAALKVLLLTLAVADDIGAILIIAVFYNSGVVWTGLVVALGGALGFWALRAVGKRPGWLYFSPLVVVWGGLLEAGVHPTLAGVVIGLMIPTKAWIPRGDFAERAQPHLEEIGRATDSGKESADAQEKRAAGAFFALRHAASEALSPLTRLEHAIQPLVVFAIMPLFALANAGVYLGGDTLAHLDLSVGAGIALGLFIGKPVGVLVASWLSTRLGWCQLPSGVNWTGIFVVGLLAGIGFTMSNFTALLAFEDASLIGTAKLAILIGSGLSIVVGLSVGSRLLAVKREGREAADLVEAESSDAV